MNDRVIAIKEFLKLNYQELDRSQMQNLYVRIFDFPKRYAFAEAIDLYVDIDYFIKEGVKLINKGKETWYKNDFIDAGLIKSA